jgi:hypothetical protein
MNKNILDKKVEISLPNDPQVVKVAFGEETILVKTHIDRFDKVDILSTYHEYFFENEDSAVTRYLSAKYSFMLAVLIYCTNIDTNDGKIDLDSVIYSGLWKKIINEIDNFNVVTKDLYGFIKMVSEERAVEKSIGKVIDNIYSGLTGFINDLDPEQLSKYVEEFKDGLKSLESSGVILPDSLSQDDTKEG